MLFYLQIRSLNNNLEQSWSSEEELKKEIIKRECVIDAQKIKVRRKNNK